MVQGGSAGQRVWVSLRAPAFERGDLGQHIHACSCERYLWLWLRLLLDEKRRPVRNDDAGMRRGEFGQ